MSCAIGIDLGSSCSRVAVWQNSRVEVILNSHGSRETPSYVAFVANRRLVGNAAFNQAEANPENTIFDSKRLLARSHTDPDCPAICVEYMDKNILVSPEQVLSLVLADLCETAEAYMGATAKNAVISVPACFSDAQCHATMTAAKLAGLNLLQIIRDPLATALAYSNPTHCDKLVCLVDLGAGTLDASLLRFNGSGVAEAVATAGNSRLGGRDFDSRLLAYLMDQFTAKHGVDVSNSASSVQRLRFACERAKRTLSTSTTAIIDIDSLLNGINFATHITRSKFEHLCADLFDQVIVSINQVMSTAGVARHCIHDVVLVGGSTRIPKLQHMVSAYFGGRPLTKIPRPDEAVVAGAAIVAASLNHEVSEQIQRLCSLGTAQNPLDFSHWGLPGLS
ncbi:Hsp70 chaperone [Coemansia sp. RSA 2320]|nr:Hsp70 chaperone [Coemansia sp. RSA 2320]